MTLSVVTQPNIPIGPLPVVSQPQQPTLAPQVQSTPTQPQPAALPVQSAPSQPQPANLPVESAPQNQQQSVSVQLPSIVTGIQTAINRGAQPDQILQALAQQHPEMQDSITQATSRGATPQQILAQIVQQYSGIPQDSPAQPQHIGFIQSLVQSLTKWATAGIGVPLYDAGNAAVDLLKGNPQAAASDISKPRNLGYLGNVAPVELDSNHLGKTAAQLAGLAAQGASLAIPNPIAAGATFGAADALAQNKSIGGIAEETTLGALGGKLGDLAASGISKTLSSLFTDGGVGGNIINSLIKPLSKEFRFGKNPGAGVAAEKIVADSLPDLEKQVNQKLGSIGEQIGTKLADVVAANPTKTADYSAVLQPFDDAIEEAAKGGPNNQPLITRLNNTKDALQYEMEVRQGTITPKLSASTEPYYQPLDANGNPIKSFVEPQTPQPAKLTALNASQGNALKQKIGGLRKWTGNPSEDTIYNQAVAKAYHSANNIVENEAPGTKALNARYANLLSAQSSIERQTTIQARQGLLGTLDKLGLGAAGLSLIHGDIKGAGIELGLALANHTLGSTAVKTRLAAALSTVPDLAGQLFEANPTLQGILGTTAKAATTTGKYVGSRLGARLTTGSLGR